MGRRGEPAQVVLRLLLEDKKEQRGDPSASQVPKLLLRLGACRLSCIRLKRTCSPHPAHREHLLMGPRDPPLPSWPALASGLLSERALPVTSASWLLYGAQTYFFDLQEIAAYQSHGLVGGFPCKFVFFKGDFSYISATTDCLWLEELII